MNIYGGWDSSKGRSISFELHRCKDKPDCKSDEEINQALKGNYLTALHNQIRFDQRLLGD